MAEATHQLLHRGERTTLLMDETLRRMGYAGFNLQFHVAFEGRCNATALQSAIERLSRKYPVTTARLDRAQATRPVWRLRPGAVCEFRETTLDGPGDAPLLGHAARALATSRPLDEADPMEFELVHLPDGRDVLIVHYSHVLMDSNAIVLMLHELNRLHACPETNDGGPVVENDDYRGQHVARFSLATRWRAMAHTALGRLKLMRKTPVMLSNELAPPGSVPPSGLIVHTLDAETTAAIVARVRRVTGFRGISLALLVSLFRALRNVAPRPMAAGSVFLASAGMNLRDPGATHPIFRIVSSMLRFGITAAELADRDECLRRLNQTMRRELANNADLGLLQLTSLVRYGTASGRKLTDSLMQRQQSFTYGYFGSLTLERPGLCGNPIERMYHVVQTWSPPGLSVVANESYGRLIFSVGYTPATVSKELAERFVDEFVRDLTEE